jgi:hypothetical protein
VIGEVLYRVTTYSAVKGLYQHRLVRFHMKLLQFTRNLLGMVYLLLLQKANVAQSLHIDRYIGRGFSRSKSSSLRSSVDPGERALTMGKALGISGTTRHIFLCADQTKPKCCSKADGLESWDFLKARLKELKLVGPNALVGRTKANCLQVSNLCFTLQSIS